MKFDLKVRAVMEDESDLQMYLDALQEEISNTSRILQVERDGLMFRIETNGTIETNELMKCLKPAFSSSLGLYVGFASLEHMATEPER